MKIQWNVCWHEGANRPDNRCWLGITKLLNDAFDGCEKYEFVHRSTMKELPAGVDEAVIVVHGEQELTRIDEIQRDVDKLKRALIIIIGDESGKFPGGRLKTLDRIIWYQFPTPGAHASYSSRNFICGYPPDLPQYVTPEKAARVERGWDWSFLGQITHERRQQAAAQMRQLPNGFLLENAGFWQGLDRQKYYDILLNTKIVPCPSGPGTPDSFRLAEALEAGCLPIVDATCPRARYPEGFWKNIFGYDPPFPIINEWSELPRFLTRALAEWPANRDTAYKWWQAYKDSMKKWLSDDIDYLRSR